MTVNIRRVKRTLTVYPIDPPFVQGTDGLFEPYKLEVVEYEDHGRVTLTGEGRSVNYRLYGYPQYDDPCPDWVMEIINEAGWSLTRLWGSKFYPDRKV